jgi:conjugal transfer pilus assembly protein TraD
MTSRPILDFFRPAVEQYAAIGWAAGALATVIFRPPFWFVLLVVLCALSAWRGRQAIDLYKFWWRISGHTMQKLSMDEYAHYFAEARRRKSFFMGFGFDWDVEHTQLATEINSRNKSELRSPPDWILSPHPNLPTPLKAGIELLREAVFPPNFVPVDDAAVGEPWIHGMAAQELPLYMPFSCMTAHTRLPGTTRAGKSVCLKLLFAQILALKHPLICFDPKSSRDLRESLRFHAKLNKRKFLVFDPANPATSVRISPLENWTTVTEPASRVSNNVDADGSFLAFAWKTLYRIYRAMVMIGQKPTLSAARRVVTNKSEQTKVLEKLLQKYFDLVDGDKWRASFKLNMANPKPPVDSWIERFENDERTSVDSDLIQATQAMIAMHKHDEGHYTKMVQPLEPILEMLGSGELGRLLTPDLSDLNDTREVWSLKRIVQEGAVLYIASNSLADGTIGSALLSMFASDLTSLAGEIQNLGIEGQQEIYVGIDESAEAVNNQVIQLLNKGGGAGIRLLMAYQTDADFADKLKSKDKAEMALGNLNNTIAFRLMSTATAENVSKLFGSTRIVTQGRSMSTGSESSANFTEFRGQVTRSENLETVPRVSIDLLTRLGPGNFFGFWAGRRLVKGRMVLLDEPKLFDRATDSKASNDASYRHAA